MTSTYNKQLDGHNIEPVESMDYDEGIEMSPQLFTVQLNEGLMAGVSLEAYNKLLRATKRKDQVIAQQNDKIRELETKLAEAAKAHPAEESRPKREYVYDTSIICGDSNEEKDRVIDVLVDLLNYRHGKTYLIANSRCWYVVYRCLNFYRILDSECKRSEFNELVNETVLKWIDDEARYDTLFCKDVNFRNINEDHPLRQNDPDEWERKYKFNKHLTSLKYGVKIKKFLNNKLKFEK